ncbi:MAG TPA: extracellular solute-binding protein [Alphaproteobacteria bacterium]|jgi:ABC-type Fe3+ transport system substrate-binding protein
MPRLRKLTLCVFSAALIFAAPAADAADLPASTREFLQRLKQPPTLLKDIDAALAVPPAMLAAAKQEPGVRIGGTLDPKQFREMVRPFEERYPFVKITYMRGSRFNRTVQPLIALKEGRVTVDVISSLGNQTLNYRDAGAFAPLGDLPAYRALEADYKGQRDLWAGQRLLFYCMAYNTNLVKPQDLPKDWDDVLKDTRLHGGKIGLTNKPDDWFLHLVPSRGMDWGKHYLAQLFGTVKPQLRKEGKNAVTALAVAGEFPVTMVSLFSRVAYLQKKGSPIDMHCPGSVAASLSEIAVLKASPALNQGLLFTNWLVSREGQLAQYVASNYDPLHEDLRDAGLESLPGKLKGKKVNVLTIDILEKYGDEVGALWQAHWSGKMQ